MPWKTDLNGERKYVPSIYAKEELPTWGEIYEEFLRCHRFYYDPQAGEQMMDNYWRIPRLKVLLATVCNQLNKLIFEDGMREQALKYINENIMDGAIDLRFTCELVEPWDYYRIMDPTRPVELDRLEGYLEKWSAAMDAARVGTSSPHPIYTIPLPTGEPNPFILASSSNIERRNVAEMNDVMCVHPMILFQDPPLKSTDSRIYTPRPFDPLQYDDWKKIIDFMFSDVLIYFEGSPGWKDDQGRMVSFNHVDKKCPSGHDPAL